MIFKPRMKGKRDLRILYEVHAMTYADVQDERLLTVSFGTVLSLFRRDMSMNTETRHDEVRCSYARPGPAKKK